MKVILTWLRLIRVFNVPIVLSAVLAGALAATQDDPEGLPLWKCAFLVVETVFAVAAVQSYNDYEDREADAVNAGFRPIPSGAFTAEFVLKNGHACAAIVCVTTSLVSIRAALVAALWFLLTRWYSYVKKFSVVHHVLMPAALSLTPIYGALAAKPQRENEFIPAGTCDVPISVYIVAASIFLIDVNMNIVGTFKDIFDGSSEERILPLVIGRRPAIVFAAVVGAVGILIQVIPILTRDSSWVPLIPLGLGLVVHIESRRRLFFDPVAKEGYRALKAGRIVECLCFPALLFGVRPPIEATAILVALVGSAAVLQACIKEAVLPEADDKSVEVHKNNGQQDKSLVDMVSPNPRLYELGTIAICVGLILAAFAVGNPQDGSILIRLYIPLICCGVGTLSVVSTLPQQDVVGFLKNSRWYTLRYLAVVAFFIAIDMLIHYLLAGEISFVPISNWAALVASASIINPSGTLFVSFISFEKLVLNVPCFLAIMAIQVGQAALSVLGSSSTTETIALLVVRRLLVLGVTHVISMTSYGSNNSEMLRECRTFEYVAHHACAKGRQVILDTSQAVVIGSALLKTPMFAGESMTSGKPSLMRVFDKLILVEQMLACSSPTILCNRYVAFAHLAFMYDMFASQDTHLNPDLEDPELCLWNVKLFLRGRFEEFSKVGSMSEGTSLLGPDSTATLGV